MRIVAVVLNWRRPDDTIACVRSVQDTAPDVSVLVVDNASGDDSVERIAAAVPGARVLAADQNLGYAGGNNIGIGAALEAGTDAVLILNNDVIVRPGCVEQLAAALRARPDAAIVAPLSLNAEDPSRIDFFRARVDLRNVALLAEGRGEHRSTVFATEPVGTDYATGSALLCDAGRLEHLGGFDDRFFLVWEDVDLSLSIRGTTLVVPTAEVLHTGGVSFGEQRTTSPLYQYCFARNSFLIVRKHVRWPFMTATLRRIEQRYRGWAATSEPDLARAMTLGIEHGLGQRYGPPPVELMPPGSVLPPREGSG